MRIEEVQFVSRGPHPVSLYGKVHYFEDGRRRPTAIVCHPSSSGECDLEHPFVVNVCEALNESGFNTFRFNFRGVAPSEGVLTKGKDELSDVLAALDQVSEREDVDGDRLYAIGHSFGAAMSLRTMMLDDRICGVVASGLPVNNIEAGRPLYFPRYCFDVEGLRQCSKPMAFVAGSHDHLCPLASLEAFMAQLPKHRQFTEISDVDHYFRRPGRRGVIIELARQTAETIRSIVVGWSNS